MMLRFMKASSPLWASADDESAFAESAGDGA